MKIISTQKGFAPIIIVIIAAVVVAGGAGTYQVVKKNNEKKAEASMAASSSAEVSTQVNATTTVELKGYGTLRSLIARNKDAVCTVTVSQASSTSQGTMYISEGMMRGDFTAKSSNSAAMESHMIKNGDTMYMWSGSQGVKMDASASSNSNASTQGQSTVDLDQTYSYDCKDWSKDVSKFTAPTTIKFMDMNAMLKTQGQVQIPSGVKVNGTSSVNLGM